jgi:predicted NUDIX family NTP pyrophosphohydrolase
MAATRSAGILVFRRTVDGGLEVLLAHMGGPFWQGKDDGAWSLPKGEHPTDEEPIDAARREFEEELGLPVPDGELLPLGEARQPSGKVVTAWAVDGDVDPEAITPGHFELEWPPRSGRTRSFPEIDRVAWFAPGQARDKLVSGQRVFLDRLAGLDIPYRQ